MNIDVERKNGHAVVSMHGTLIGPEKSQQLKQQLEELSKTDINKIIIDMQNVNFTDSTGIGVLIICFKKVKQAGGNLIIANANATVRNILSITKLDNIFQIYDSVDEAESSLSK